jgi:hypothetical protein
MNLSRIRAKGNLRCPAGRRARLLDLDFLAERRTLGLAGYEVQARAQRAALEMRGTGAGSPGGPRAVQTENLNPKACVLCGYLSPTDDNRYATA